MLSPWKIRLEARWEHVPMQVPVRTGQVPQYEPSFSENCSWLYLSPFYIFWQAARTKHAAEMTNRSLTGFSDLELGGRAECVKLDCSVRASMSLAFETGGSEALSTFSHNTAFSFGDLSPWILGVNFKQAVQVNVKWHSPSQKRDRLTSVSSFHHTSFKKACVALVPSTPWSLKAVKTYDQQICSGTAQKTDDEPGNINVSCHLPIFWFAPVIQEPLFNCTYSPFL